jgi:hypothetical protein
MTAGPYLADAGSQPWQLFGLLAAEHSDPRYSSVFFNLGVLDLLCPDFDPLSYLISIIQGVG